MADVTVTAANVVPVAGYSFAKVTSGATITAGQVVYLDTSDSNKAKLAQADGTGDELVVKGIALNGASSGQPIEVMTGGSLGFGAVLTKGEIYLCSATAGGIAPEADISTSTHSVNLLGVATSTSNLKVLIFNSGATIP